jgi:hypothetical protein
MPDQAFKLALLGHTNRQMALFFEVSESLFDLWISTHPALKRRIKEGREKADAEVAQSLYRRAVGETVVVERAFQRPDGTVEKVSLTQQMPGDPGAALKWLGLRQRERWSEPAAEVNVNARVAATVTTLDPSKLSDAALAEVMGACIENPAADSGGSDSD